jgi:hypothetical protein
MRQTRILGAEHPQIKQGAELGRDVGGREDLPAAVRLVLARPAGDESGRPSSASLFQDEGLPPYKKRILGLLKADQATHIDEIATGDRNVGLRRFLGALRIGVGGGKVRQMSGKNFVRSF